MNNNWANTKSATEQQQQKQQLTDEAKVSNGQAIQSQIRTHTQQADRQTERQTVRQAFALSAAW